jgi:acyl-CoA synthetase (AMP-forming)/AMP-acid ligase II
VSEPEELPLWDLIEWRAAQTPDDVLVIDEHDRTITFGEHRDRAERVAAAFAATGVGTGTPVAWMLPTWIEALVLAGALARLGAERAFPDLRALVGGGAAKPPTLDDEVRELLRVPLVTGYGSSECPGVSHSGVWDTEDDLRADGHAMDDCELRTVDDDGRDCPPGVPGEIVVKGPMLFLGYLDPDEDDGIDAEGWFHTGDVGTLDERGFLKVTGRLKDIVIRKGENISAKEVEDALHRHPAVLDAAVIALPDAERGELCCGVVVLHGGATLTLDELGAHCAGLGLARQKVPERLEVLDVLPRNATGKVLKPELVARFRP